MFADIDDKSVACDIYSMSGEFACDCAAAADTSIDVAGVDDPSAQDVNVIFRLANPDVTRPQAMNLARKSLAKCRSKC